MKDNTYPVLSEWLALSAISELRSVFGEFRKTSDRKIFLVRLSSMCAFFCLNKDDDVIEVAHLQQYSLSLTFFTLGRTYGLPFSSRYAPTPRLILRGSLSALKASVTPSDCLVSKPGHPYSAHCVIPRMGSGGPAGTFDHVDTARSWRRERGIARAAADSILETVASCSRGCDEGMSVGGRQRCGGNRLFGRRCEVIMRIFRVNRNFELR